MGHSTKLWAQREIKLVWNFYCVCSCESILWNWRQSFFETLSVVLCLREMLPKMRGNRSFRHHPSYVIYRFHTHTMPKPIRKNEYDDANLCKPLNTLVRLVDGIDDGGDSRLKHNAGEYVTKLENTFNVAAYLFIRHRTCAPNLYSGRTIIPRRIFHSSTTVYNILCENVALKYFYYRYHHSKRSNFYHPPLSLLVFSQAVVASHS